MFIHPTGDDAEDHRDADRVCGCVASHIDNEWTIGRRTTFSALLTEHSEKVLLWIDELETTESDSITWAKSSPKPSNDLTLELEAIVPFVDDCEESIGTNVEF